MKTWLLKAKKLLKSKAGMSGFIDIAVEILITMILLTVAITYLNVYAKHNLVNTMAHEIARYVEVKGQINSDTYTEFDRLKDASGFTGATVTFDKSGKLALEEAFTVTVSVQQKVGVGGIDVFPVTVKAVSTGRSEVYWK